MKSSKTSVYVCRRAAASCCLVLAVMIGTTSQAYAYIDPGYGSLLWQLAVAGFIGAAFYYRQFVAKLRTWFRAMFRTDQKNG
jgi:hypothetical protein